MFASVFVVVAALAALVTLPLAWVGHNVADEDGYVAFTSPMGSDPELQKAFSAYLSDYFVREGRLPSALQPTVATVLATAAATTANAPGFTEAWEESQRRSHRLMFGPNAKQDRLAVDLGLLAPIGAQQVIHGLLALIQETHEGVREVLDVAADLVELFRNAGLFELQGRARTFAGGL